MHFTDFHITLQLSSPALFWSLLLPVFSPLVWLFSLFLGYAAGHVIGKKPQRKAARKWCVIWKGSSASGATEKAQNMPPCCAVWENRNGDKGVGLPPSMWDLTDLLCVCHGFSFLGSLFHLKSNGECHPLGDLLEAGL